MAQRSDEELYLRNLASGDPRYGTFAFQPRPGAKIPNISGPYPKITSFEDPRSLVLPGGGTAGDAGDVIPALLSWQPQDGDASFPENIVGWDMSMDVSDRERHGWYTSNQYLGEDHRKYIADAESLLDQPLIPQAAAQDAGWVGKKEGDVTPREFLDSLPSIEFTRASREYMADRGNPEKKAAYQQASRNRILAVANPVPFSETPEGRAVWAGLTGQIYDRNRFPYADLYAKQMVDAIGSGRTNRANENDPSRTQSEFDQLQQQYGDEANRMLTPGGVANAKREAAYDFFGAMQGNSRYAPHLDNTSSWMNMLLAAASTNTDMPVTRELVQANDENPFMRRTQEMMQPGLSGRMRIASSKLANAQQQFAAGGDKPFVTTASLLNRTDPLSYQGLYNLAGNSSWAFGRNFQNPYEPVFGEMVTRSRLGDRNLEFFQDLNDRTFREAPVRPDWQSPEDFRETRAFTIDRRNSSGDYFDTFAPLVADAYNSTPLGAVAPMQRTYPTGGTSIAYQMIPAIGRSATQSAMIGLPIAGQLASTGGAGAGAIIKGLATQYPFEVIQEGFEEATQDPQGIPGLFTTKTYNAWMQPNPPMSKVRDADGNEYVRSVDEYRRMLDPRNKEEWNRGVEETKERRLQQAKDQYEQWDRNAPRPAQPVMSGVRPLLLN